MKKKHIKKLQLNRETLRLLTDKDLDGVAGGGVTDRAGCVWSRDSCPDGGGGPAV